MGSDTYLAHLTESNKQNVIAKTKSRLQEQGFTDFKIVASRKLAIADQKGYQQWLNGENKKVIIVGPNVVFA